MSEQEADTIPTQDLKNSDITIANELRAISSWKMTPVKPNPECVREFFKRLELRGMSLTAYADGKNVNRSKLSQILHGISVPKTPQKRKFWSEAVLDFDVQIFWIPKGVAEHEV